MPSAHIFTVDPITFNTHLRYMFAGTGKGRGRTAATEQLDALADILCIRPKDNILFYVTNHGFYGFFEAVMANRKLVFYEKPTNQYLDNELNQKTLTYRIFIKPSQYGVYRFGRNEWDAIENPQKIENANLFKMQWSWIFNKKLSGNRGCITIPAQEFELLKNIITKGNERITKAAGYGYSEGQIVAEKNNSIYKGLTCHSPILSGNIRKITKEVNMRIFFCAEAGNDNILNKVIQPNKYGSTIYLSNETRCSFGMKSIDLLFFTDHKKCLLIELKKGFDFENRDIEKVILEQVGGYAQWVSSYKTDLAEIIPILILGEPKLYSATRRGKKFKYLSKSDYQKNAISPWYKEKIANLKNATKKLSESNIKNLAPLQIYIFKVDSNNILQDFCCV